MTNIQQRQAQLRQLCESLKKTDADLLDLIQFGYDGNYPQNDPDGAFAKWRQEVEPFIQKPEHHQASKP
jgi:hypothetical protein